MPYYQTAHQNLLVVVRLCAYIATDGDFFDQPKAADAGSELFRDVFGEDKTSVRMVLGVPSLPLGIFVAVKVILEITGNLKVILKS